MYFYLFTNNPLILFLSSIMIISQLHRIFKNKCQTQEGMSWLKEIFLRHRASWIREQEQGNEWARWREGQWSRYVMSVSRKTERSDRWRGKSRLVGEWNILHSLFGVTTLLLHPTSYILLSHTTISSRWVDSSQLCLIQLIYWAAQN